MAEVGDHWVSPENLSATQTSVLLRFFVLLVLDHDLCKLTVLLSPAFLFLAVRGGHVDKAWRRQLSEAMTANLQGGFWNIFWAPLIKWKGQRWHHSFFL